MPSAFDDLLQEARDAGVDSDWLERFEKASNGSPLRQDKKQLEAELQTRTEEAQRYRTFALNGQFEKLGIKVKPDALNIPHDLDPLDTEKVTEWAVGMGLAEPPPPPTPPEHQEAHQRLVETTTGGGVPAPPDVRAEVLAAETEEEFDAKARAAGLMK